jgi:hypothetical protein
VKLGFGAPEAGARGEFAYAAKRLRVQ